MLFKLIKLREVMGAIDHRAGARVAYVCIDARVAYVCIEQDPRDR